MKTWMIRGLLLLGLLLILVWLRAPAKHAVGYYSADISPTVIAGVSGTVWDGQAQQISSPYIQLNNVRWNYRALASLFSGPGVHITGNTNNGQFDGQAHIGWLQLNENGSATITDLTALIPLSDIALPAAARSVPLTGDIIAKLDEFAIEQQWPSSANGQIAIADIQFQDQQRWQLGTLVADLETVDDVIEAKLSSESDFIQLQGVASLSPDGSYQLTADLNLSSNLPIVLRTMLAASGKRQSDGSIRISYQGQVPRPATNTASDTDNN